MRPFHRPLPARLIFSILAASWADWPELKKTLEQHFGPAATDFGPIDFAWTDYYDAELGGPPLYRRFLSFGELVEQDSLVRVKLRALALEGAYSGEDGRRRFNLDPGLLTHDRFVLASVKNYTHRIYLGQGIFADLTMIYRQGAWRTLDWTYPGYTDPALLEHLHALRAEYGQEIRRLGLKPQPLDLSAPEQPIIFDH